jgi:hypothetical protein
MRMHYYDGEEVQFGDIVDVGAGNGPEMRVVVIVPDQAAEGFDAEHWRYLGAGVLLQDTAAFGLAWLDNLDHEYVFVRRA